MNCSSGVANGFTKNIERDLFIINNHRSIQKFLIQYLVANFYLTERDTKLSYNNFSFSNFKIYINFHITVIT